MRRSIACCLVLIVFLLLPCPGAGQAATAEDAGAPVIYRGREIFRIHLGVGALTPSDRARMVSERLDGLVTDLSFDPARVEIEDGETFSELVHGDRVLGVITDADAAAAGRPRPEYAREVRDRLIEIVSTARDELSASSIVIGIGWAALATIVALSLGMLLMRLCGRVEARVERWYRGLTADPRIGRAAARRTMRVGAMTHTTVRLGAVSVAVAIVAVWVQVVLQVLPWSRPFAQQIYRYVSTPLREVWLAVLGFVPNLFFLAVIGLTTVLLLRIVHIVFNEIAEGNIRLASFPAEWASPTYKLVRAVVLAIALVAAFPYVPGSQSPAFQGISLFVGLLVSLASTSALSNVIAGTILTYTRAFKLGDIVHIGSTLGEVTETRLLMTRVRTPKNELVSIPNSQILSTHVVNYTAFAAERGLIAHTSVSIGYDAPWRKVHELLVAAAQKTEGILKEPPPFVLQTALNDFSVTYEINAFVASPFPLLRTYSALHANIQECFNAAGVEILSPNYVAVRSGGRAASSASSLAQERL